MRVPRSEGIVPRPREMFLRQFEEKRYSSAIRFLEGAGYDITPDIRVTFLFLPEFPSVALSLAASSKYCCWGE